MVYTYWCIRLPQCLYVCVCMHHQNVKLMIHAVNPSLDYKNVLKLCVCGITNQNCMLHHCDLCPDESVIRDFLMQQLQNSNCSPSDLIKYKQWVSTDRSQLEDHKEDFDDFLAKPLSMLF